jgi:hypothetical protein
VNPADTLGVVDPGRGKRVLAVVAIAAAAVTVLLTGLQIHLANQGQRANLLAARHVVKLYATVSMSGSLATFTTQSNIAAIDMEIRGLARQFVAVGGGTVGDVELTLGRADRTAAAQAQALVREMGRPPAGPGIDAATRTALTATPSDWEALVAEQNRLVDQAARAGRRADRVLLGLTLTAVASALFGLAGALATLRPVFIVVGGLLLLIGTGYGGLAWLW